MKTIWDHKKKRILDLTIASAVGVIAFPFLFVPAAIIIKINDIRAGRLLLSPIYKQTRMGQNGKDFTIYKLRTMVPSDTESDELNLRSVSHRVTRVGAILRKTKIDELPQLWNVLKGDMSIVGPRPTYTLEEKKAVQPNTLKHKPGLTGPFQNASFDREMSLEERANIEAQYKFSIRGDLKIMWETVCLLKDSALNPKNARDNTVDAAKCEKPQEPDLAEMYDDNDPNIPENITVNGESFLARFSAPSL